MSFGTGLWARPEVLLRGDEVGVDYFDWVITPL
jgi:hypothetical protein